MQPGIAGRYATGRAGNLLRGVAAPLRISEPLFQAGGGTSGLLLSRNYPPSDDLTPFVRRHYVFEARLPDDFLLIDKLLSETAFIRVLLHGDWAAQTGPDSWSHFGPVPLMGPNAIPWRVRVRGPFRVIGVSIRPSGWLALFNRPARVIADTAMPLGHFWGSLADELYHELLAAQDDAGLIAVMEAILRRRLAMAAPCAPMPAMAAFEEIARHDSTIQVTDAARQLGLSVRQFERQCHASFGHSPKVILRRSRFLDMAQAMRGFSEPSAQQLAALRYFDQSHRNREFRHFFELTPGQFDKVTTPLFTAGLKLRADGHA